MKTDDYDEYEKAIVQRIRKAFMIPDEMDLTQNDIRRIRKATLIDYWSTRLCQKRENIDLLLHGSYSRWEAQVIAYKKCYSATPWFTGEFTKEQKERMGWPVEKSVRGMTKSIFYSDDFGFYAEDVNNHGDNSTVITKSDDTVVVAGRRAGLTHAALTRAYFQMGDKAPYELTDELRMKNGLSFANLRDSKTGEML